MQRFITAFVFSSALFVVMLANAACAPAGRSEVTAASVAPDQTQRVTISVSNGMRFEPAAIRVRAGQPVELTLRNPDQSAHDLTLNEGAAQPVKLAVNGAETSSRTVTFDKPGTYTVECSMPGHALAGMRGTITVR